MPKSDYSWVMDIFFLKEIVLLVESHLFRKEENGLSVIQVIFSRCIRVKVKREILFYGKSFVSSENYVNYQSFSPDVLFWMLVTHLNSSRGM